MDDFGSGRPTRSTGTSRVGKPSGLASQRRAANPLKVSGWQNASPMSVASLRGNIVVLKFWATWCPPCIRAIPLDNELHETYRQQGVVMIGVCTGDDTAEMGAIANSENIGYPIVQDLKSQTAQDYNVKSYPTYVVIDRNGEVAFPRCKKRDVEDAIRYLLNGK